MQEMKCPHCSNIIQIPENVIGRSVRCGTCRTIFAVGKDAVPPSAMQNDFHLQPIDQPSYRKNSTPETRFCGNCGTQWTFGRSNCEICGYSPSRLASHERALATSEMCIASNQLRSRWKKAAAAVAIVIILFVIKYLPTIRSDPQTKQETVPLVTASSPAKAITGRHPEQPGTKVTSTIPQRAFDVTTVAENDPYKNLLAQIALRNSYDEIEKAINGYLTKHPSNDHKSDVASLILQLKRKTKYAEIWAFVSDNFLDKAGMLPMQANANRWDSLQTVQEIDQALAGDVTLFDKGMLQVKKGTFLLKARQYTASRSALSAAEAHFNQLRKDNLWPLNHAMLGAANYNTIFVEAIKLRCDALARVDKKGLNSYDETLMVSEVKYIQSMRQLIAAVSEDQEYINLAQPLDKALYLLENNLPKLFSDSFDSSIVANKIEESSPQAPVCSRCNGIGTYSVTSKNQPYGVYESAYRAKVIARQLNDREQEELMAQSLSHVNGSWSAVGKPYWEVVQNGDMYVVIRCRGIDDAKVLFCDCVIGKKAKSIHEQEEKEREQARKEQEKANEERKSKIRAEEAKKNADRSLDALRPQIAYLEGIVDKATKDRKKIEDELRTAKGPDALRVKDRLSMAIGSEKRALEMLNAQKVKNSRISSSSVIDKVQPSLLHEPKYRIVLKSGQVIFAEGYGKTITQALPGTGAHYPSSNVFTVRTADGIKEYLETDIEKIERNGTSIAINELRPVSGNEGATKQNDNTPSKSERQNAIDELAAAKSQCIDELAGIENTIKNLSNDNQLLRSQRESAIATQEAEKYKISLRLEKIKRELNESTRAK